MKASRESLNCSHHAVVQLIYHIGCANHSRHVSESEALEIIRGMMKAAIVVNWPESEKFVKQAAIGYRSLLFIGAGYPRMDVTLVVKAGVIVTVYPTWHY